MFGFSNNKSKHGNGPDFSSVDSRAKAEDLFHQGQLEKLLLLPLEFGGDDQPENILYVPVGVAAVKSGIDLNIIRPLVSEGKISQYEAEPEYQGDSFIPISINIRAWEPGKFATTINIWRAALARENA
jgi:hypothetical protein